MKQQQHHQNSMLQQLYYLLKHSTITGQTKPLDLVDTNTTEVFKLTERKWIKNNTSLRQISFNLLICRELNSNMTDTNQGRDQTTFGKKILASISGHRINN